jgi:hypothetical protein
MWSRPPTASEGATVSDRYFLVSQDDIDRIDALVGALNLAINEILEAHPIIDRERMDAQREYDAKVAEVVYDGDLRDHL